MEYPIRAGKDRDKGLRTTVFVLQFLACQSSPDPHDFLTAMRRSRDQDAANGFHATEFGIDRRKWEVLKAIRTCFAACRMQAVGRFAVDKDVDPLVRPALVAGNTGDCGSEHSRNVASASHRVKRSHSASIGLETGERGVLPLGRVGCTAVGDNLERRKWWHGVEALWTDAVEERVVLVDEGVQCSFSHGTRRADSRPAFGWSPMFTRESSFASFSVMTDALAGATMAFDAPAKMCNASGQEAEKRTSLCCSNSGLGSESRQR